MANRFHTPIALASAAALIAGLATAPSQAAEPVDAGPADAQADYERNHWQRAFDALAKLADEGYADAARWAGLMVRHGPALYGSRFEADPQRRQRWLALASGQAPALLAATSTDREEPRP